MSKIICIDIDNTICRTKLSQYRKSKPNKKKFITTPNRFYPIEFHTKLPLIHWIQKKDSSFYSR